MKFIRKLPIPQAVKEDMPLSENLCRMRALDIAAISDIIRGRSDRFLLVVGPCSADRRDSVLDYCMRLSSLRERVGEKVLIIPRLYTSKPRTNGGGYTGISARPDPSGSDDMLAGLVAARALLLDVAAYTGLFGADELLYPENFRYFSDIIAYTAVGARSCEDQMHRMLASGLDIPVGIKNPTSGDIDIMFNSVFAAQNPHKFVYRGWEVESEGNALAHAVLRGGAGHDGFSPNFGRASLVSVCREYSDRRLANPCVIVDASHANSGKDPLGQRNVCLDVLASRALDSTVGHLVRGLMIESYIEDGCQEPDGKIYGLSVTDGCLGWEKTESLIYEIAEKL